jgi:predicted nucleic acid-binding protein
MSGVLVDSSVLLDIFTEDAAWMAWSSAALADAADAGRLVINPIVFAEVSVRFSKIEELDARLPRDTFVREPIPFEAAFLAGKAFLRYRRGGGQRADRFPISSLALTRRWPAIACSPATPPASSPLSPAWL